MAEKKQDKIRINKYIAQAGICSRRDADSMIDTGRVTVNGRVAVMGDRVSEEDRILLDGKAVQGRMETVVLAFNKPVGVICTEKDKFADKKILDYVKYPTRVTYAGRLDKESKGLILLSNDGEMLQKLMRGENHHEKEYIVKVKEEITPQFLEQMRGGIYLEALKRTTRSCQVESLGKYTFRIVLTQGLNRQIRRMCNALNYHVISLKRIRVMNIELGDLKEGQWRVLEKEEREKLYELCHMKPN